MTEDEYLKIANKAWEEFDTDHTEITQPHEKRVNELREKRDKIIGAALEEYLATEPNLRR